ncbi:hypothetical protein X975_25790, partial [Stegodyphus mimosarum]
MVWAGIMLDGCTPLHVFDRDFVTGVRHRDEGSELYVRLFRGALEAQNGRKEQEIIPVISPAEKDEYLPIEDEATPSTQQAANEETQDVLPDPNEDESEFPKRSSKLPPIVLNDSSWKWTDITDLLDNSRYSDFNATMKARDEFGIKLYSIDAYRNITAFLDKKKIKFNSY